MTQMICTPTRRRVALSFFLFSALLLIGATSPANAQRRSAKSKAPSKSAARKTTNKSVKNARADKRRGVSTKSAKAGKRSAKKTAVARRNDRPVSRRQRAAESRRSLAQRRREAREAARRAEIARQAAIARQRAIEQALRDEVAANIARDMTVGEDMEVRRAAVAALGNLAGTVVVMDPRNGKVYTVVNQEWALRKGYKPCSTIKLVTGVAGLCENVIDPMTQVSGRGVDLTDSLAYSDNPFFQKVGGTVGFERILDYARDLGLGERTGINYPNESAGRVPLFKSGWAVNRMCSHGDDFEVTPVQLATLVSAIANGGNLLTPHVPRTPQETVKFNTEVRRRVKVPEENLRRMIPGMIGAVNYGTGRGAYDATQTVAGKTGTCIGQGGWLGLFTSYAPVNDPKLAVVVVIRGAGARGKTAAAVAGKIFRGLHSRFGTPINMQYANTPGSLVPKPKVDPKTAIVSDELDPAEAARNNPDLMDETNSANNSRGTVKSVLMPVPARSPEPRSTTPSPAKDSPDAQRPRRVVTNP